MTTLTPTGPVKMSGEVLKTKTLILTQEMNLQIMLHSIGESETDAGHLLLLRCTERSCSPRSEDSQHPQREVTNFKNLSENVKSYFDSTSLFVKYLGQKIFYELSLRSFLSCGATSIHDLVCVYLCVFVCTPFFL